MARTKAFVQEEALQKALEVFWHKGYEATSLQDLVNAMGINRQSIYDTFGDKHALFLSALDYYDTRQRAKVTALLEESTSARTAILDLLNSSLQEVLANQRQGCFVVNTTVEMAVQDNEITRRTLANQAYLEEALQQVIVRGQRTGEINTRHSPEKLARFLFNNVLGLRVMIKSCTDTETLRDVVEVVMAALN